MTFRIWVALENLQYLDNHEPQRFDFCIGCTPTDRTCQLYHHQVKIMLIYETTNLLVSGAFLKCFSIELTFRQQNGIILVNVHFTQRIKNVLKVYTLCVSLRQPRTCKSFVCQIMIVNDVTKILSIFTQHLDKILASVNEPTRFEHAPFRQ